MIFFHFRCYIKTLKANGKHVAVTATTGLASQQFLDLGGVTLHHWAGMMDGRFAKEELLENLLYNDGYHRALDRIKKTDVLFIDEVSMMSAKTFECLEFVCRMIKNAEIQFGGLQVVASGDFKQLPPVPDHFHGDPGLFCFESPAFNRIFPHHIQLTQVERQEEPDLILAINELCEGKPSESTHTLMSLL